MSTTRTTACMRERLIAENGGLVYSTYFDVARRFLFRRTTCCRIPTDRVPPAPERELPRAPERSGRPLEAGRPGLAVPFQQRSERRLA